MAKHTLGLDPDPFERVKSGAKLIELRLAVTKDRQPRNLRVGDIIAFERSDDPKIVLHVKITALLYYPSFEELLADFDAKTYFGRDNAYQVLGNLARRYSPSDEQMYGVVGIKMRVLDP